MDSSKRKGDGRLIARGNLSESVPPLFPRSMNGMTGAPVVCECISDSSYISSVRFVLLTSAVYHS